MRYRFVTAERASFPVRLVGWVIGVRASGFDAWLRWVPSRRQADDKRVSEKIEAIFAGSRQTYGGCIIVMTNWG